MLSTGDLKRGVRILLDGDPYTVLDVHVQSPSARGASSLSKIKVRNLRTGSVFDKTFRGGDKLEEPNLEFRSKRTTALSVTGAALLRSWFSGLGAPKMGGSAPSPQARRIGYMTESMISNLVRS